MKISSISAYQIYDSRGYPTLEGEVVLENGMRGYGLVPSGASTGQFEALELRDRDSTYLRGKSVLKAVNHVNTEISKSLVGSDVFDQVFLDEQMIALDGTPNKSRLGANAILGVSMALANAAAKAKDLLLYEYLGNRRGCTLPLPEIQIVGGGAHADWRTDIQDFLIIANGAKSYGESLEMTFNVYHSAAELIKSRGKYSGAADEGGFWPSFDTHLEILEFMVEAIEAAGYRTGEDASISLDVAASDFYDESTGQYKLKLDDKSYSSNEFASLMATWCRDFPIISIEDPMADGDWDGWAYFKSQVSPKLQIIGDDLFTTNIDRIQEGIERGVANAVLIKLNQIGTVTETIRAIELTQSVGWRPVVSARSGETEDSFISHLAVATNAGQLKVGSFTRSERMAKWNEVLRIERDLGRRAVFEGGQIFV